MGHKIEAGGQEYDLTPQNSVVNLFRHGPEFDYISLLIPGRESHIAMFEGKLTRWLGGIALTDETKKELIQVEKDLGVYGEVHGGYPRVIIDDYPSPDEYEMRVKTLTGDIDEIEDWINGET